MLTSSHGLSNWGSLTSYDRRLGLVGEGSAHAVFRAHHDALARLQGAAEARSTDFSLN